MGKSRSQSAVGPLGRALRQWRKEAGLTVEAVGEVLDVSHAFVSQVEHGRRPLSDAQCNALAAIGFTDVHEVALADRLLRVVKAAR